uniref:Uncharacterized protein n=1 Tax=Knipowitschia caucasica TaxID=637954 RepID=A0AAV2JPC6_KNICA
MAAGVWPGFRDLVPLFLGARRIAASHGVRGRCDFPLIWLARAWGRSSWPRPLVSRLLARGRGGGCPASRALGVRYAVAFGSGAVAASPPARSAGPWGCSSQPCLPNAVAAGVWPGFRDLVPCFLGARRTAASYGVRSRCVFPLIWLARAWGRSSRPRPLVSGLLARGRDGGCHVLRALGVRYAVALVKVFAAVAAPPCLVLRTWGWSARPDWGVGMEDKTRPKLSWPNPGFHTPTLGKRGAQQAPLSLQMVKRPRWEPLRRLSTPPPQLPRGAINEGLKRALFPKTKPLENILFMSYMKRMVGLPELTKGRLPSHVWVGLRAPWKAPSPCPLCVANLSSLGLAGAHFKKDTRRQEDPPVVC